jgi:hypothetical protein
MLIQIKNRFTGAVIFQHSCEDNSISKTITEALLSYADLRGANLSYADLSYADLSYADLSNADLRGANLSNADLRDADLRDASLSNVDLSNADLSNADLSYVDLFGANLSNANLFGADLSNANLYSSNLSNVVLADGSRVVNESSVIQLGPIGSRRAYLTVYITDKGLRFDTGCQRQITREVFELRLSQEHGENDFAKEYRAALVFLDALVEIRTPKNKPHLI